MAIIPQANLFSWQEIEDLGDLERLRLVLWHLPDEALMQVLERERGRGRDDYPVRAVWNSVLAGIVFQHPSIESLRRELLRNAQLRQLCGFDVLHGAKAVPPSWVYTRFLRRLLCHDDELQAMFDRLVEEVAEHLPDFGQVAALDGKIVTAHARGRRRNDGEHVKPDGRRDLDADWTKKVYRGRREDGTLWEKVTSFFGYRLHLFVDANYELPIGFSVTPASHSEVKEAHRLADRMQERIPSVLKRCEYLLADRGFDDGAFIRKIWDELGIRPVIDIRNMWRDGEESKLVSGQRNVVYTYDGQVRCHCPLTDTVYDMAYAGFEKDRQSLKYRCPALHYGLTCKGMDECSVKTAIRIRLSEDRRVFTPLARSSHRFAELYKKRTAVERVNSRLDQSFGFENHYIRGLAKMRLRCTLALSVMLAMALGRIREKEGQHLRSLVQAA